MMYLGWNTRPTCATRGEAVAVPPTNPPCPAITWFWVLAAAIGLGALLPPEKPARAGGGGGGGGGEGAA